MRRRSSLAVTFVALLTVGWSVVASQPGGLALAADPEAELAATRAALQDAQASQQRLRDTLSEQRAELAEIIEAGPQAAGYVSGVWTGPMIGDLIEQRFQVRYHNHHVPRLLNELGFSVQRPRKRLASADAEKQAVWLRDRLPAIKKKRPRAAAS